MTLQMDAMTFTRITVDPQIMAGAPCIRSLRIPVATVLACLADGMSRDDVLAAYPDLQPEDVRESLLFAASLLEERPFPRVPKAA